MEYEALFDVLIIIGKRDVKALRVMCDNVERGCEWEGTVGTLEEHVDTCDFTVVPCPIECDKKMMRKDVIDHLEGECPNRDYECKYCQEKGTYANITQIHDALCGKKLLFCPNIECSLTMERALMKKHLEDDCKYSVISCKYERIGCDVKMKRKDIGSHEQDDKAHLHQALNTVVKLQDDLLSATETIASMKKESSAMAVKLESTSKTVINMKKEMAALLKPVTGTPGDSEEGNIELKRRQIAEFRVTKFNSKKTSNVCFHSEPFYTSSDGYHMRIQVCPNGNSDGKGTHVSVFMELISGKNDKKIKWPFTGRISIELMDQLADECHYCKSMHFEAVDNARVHGKVWGHPSYISHSELQNSKTRYLKDNTLYFRIYIWDSL